MSLRPDARILVLYPPGALGRALVDRLTWAGHAQLTVARGLDLREKEAVLALFEAELPDLVFLMPAKVCGPFDLQPAQWLHDNLTSAANVIHAAYLYDVEKLLCVDGGATFMDPVALPPAAGQWAAEFLGEVWRADAVTRGAVTELCDSYRLQYGCNFVSAVAGHVYGPGVNFDGPGHPLVPTLLREVRRARDGGAPELRLLGHAGARADLLHLHDLTDACLFLMEQVSESGPVAVGAGPGLPPTLAEVADLVRADAGYGGAVTFGGVTSGGQTLPGAGRPPLGEGPLHRAGWRATVPLPDGLRETWRWYAGQTAAP
ncbi:NAD-dependent epimerase/dehydratase family protein [Deinococcus sp. YIM 134068]|uniref:NAD-dependent epimerase/dehydratase family protein n=1 Tax=Deinococcus lichenicola TaxID=3118910 RepID=UPI002F94A865